MLGFRGDLGWERSHRVSWIPLAAQRAYRLDGILVAFMQLFFKVVFIVIEEGW